MFKSRAFMLLLAFCGTVRGSVIAGNISNLDTFQPGYYMSTGGFDFAIKFTVPGTLDWTLGSIEVPIQYLTGTDSYTLTLASGGSAPGAAMESWTMSGYAGLNTATSVLHPTLTAGQTYWLLDQAASGASMGWHLNDQGATNHSYYNDGSGWLPNAPTDIAFRVNGTLAPEPHPLTAMMGAVSAWQLMRRRRNFKGTGT